MCLQKRSGAQSYYFIGIGGVSMSALARLLHENGACVRGSDAAESDLTRMLARCHIPVSIGDGEKIEEDTVVYSGAIKEGHPQLEAARRAGKRLVERSELLGAIAEGYPHVISVAGCHGKTTASCMLAHIFLAAKAPFTAHIGGEDLSLGNYFSSGKQYFLTEACEYRRSFLSLKSEVAVILNCDLDHTDCYKNEEEILAAYKIFASQAKRTIVCADDLRARAIPHAVTFGQGDADIRAADIKKKDERYAFTVLERGEETVRITLSAIGRVHIYNALAAYTAARLEGISPQTIKAGLEAFRGVKRRFESIGTFCGVPLICDYAHHPREIASTISTAEKIAKGKVQIVFQPHTYTRTRDLMADFVAVLKTCPSPIIYATYPARENFIFEGSAAALAARLPNARYADGPASLSRRLREDLHPSDLILVLGAGDIYQIVQTILDRPRT